LYVESGPKEFCVMALPTAISLFPYFVEAHERPTSGTARGYQVIKQ